MNLPPLYTIVCLLVLVGVGYTKYRGLDVGNTLPTTSGSTSGGGGGGGSGGGFIGTTTSAHK